MFDHGGGMFFGGGLMWLFWIALIVIIVVIVKSLTASNKNTDDFKNDSPLTILKQRYARGEINEEEFERKRKQLES